MSYMYLYIYIYHIQPRTVVLTFSLLSRLSRLCGLGNSCDADLATKRPWFEDVKIVAVFGGIMIYDGKICAIVMICTIVIYHVFIIVAVYVCVWENSDDIFIKKSSSMMIWL